MAGCGPAARSPEGSWPKLDARCIRSEAGSISSGWAPASACGVPVTPRPIQRSKRLSKKPSTAPERAAASVPGCHRRVVGHGSTSRRAQAALAPGLGAQRVATASDGAASLPLALCLQFRASCFWQDGVAPAADRHCTGVHYRPCAVRPSRRRRLNQASAIGARSSRLAYQQRTRAP